jgi:hypothetical protein
MHLFCISLSGEPARQKYIAIALAVAGGVHMNGGFGAWEFPGATAVAFCAAAWTAATKKRLWGLPCDRRKLAAAHRLGCAPSCVGAADG